MKQKISGPLGIAAIVGAIALVGILGYSVMRSQGGASASDLELAAQQQAGRR